ncbi:MAG: DUF1887 family CARF protein, partial [Thermodesulfobacteriota bacterium]|nr:DUF1887 family CARF protein [Thermodesulfobacteriota bacterium]
KLRGLAFNDADVFFVNLTGGTKLMSIGVYNFFRNKQGSIFYMPIGKNLYRKIFPDVKKKEKPINYRVNIEEYLTSYGVEIIDKQSINPLLRSSGYTRRFFEYYIQAPSSDIDLLDSLRPYRSKNKVTIDKIDGLAVFLQRLNFDPYSPGRLTKAEIKYLTGEWFEEYVYSWLKSGLKLSEDAIVDSIQIKRKDAQNEFDVMFTYNNALYVIECKTSVFDKQDNRYIINETMYKLAALRMNFGLFAKAYLFTLSECGEDRGKIQQIHMDRSEVLNIKILDGRLLKYPIEQQKIVNQIIG